MIKEILLRRKIPLLLVFALTFGVLGGLADYFGPAVRVDENALHPPAHAQPKTTGAPAPAAYAVALRPGVQDRSGGNVRSLLDACASSLGYAKGNHRRAALLCARYGLDGGCGAALIRAMIPRLGYEWSENLRE